MASGPGTAWMFRDRLIPLDRGSVWDFPPSRAASERPSATLWDNGSLGRAERGFPLPCSWGVIWPDKCRAGLWGGRSAGNPSPQKQGLVEQILLEEMPPLT